MNRPTVAVVIPAHKEEKVIAHTLEAILVQCDSHDIYVVDDKSEDTTPAIARTYTPHVIKLKVNQGKAGALNTAIRYYNLPDKYQYIMFMDADTQPAPDFIRTCLTHFEHDANKEIACVVGNVRGLGGSWIAQYRIWEYTIAHAVHKRAQAHLRSILVVPGCATIYRSEIFKTLKIPSGTLTEDMDFTFLLHRQGYSNMHFENSAVVYTQDPQTLQDFITQVKRWYAGFWQAVRKHELPWHGQNLDYEVILLATEGVLNGLITLALLAALPLLVAHHSLGILVIPALIDLCGFFIPTLLWTSWKTKRWNLILYIPAFYALRLLTSLLFFESFFRAHVSSKKRYTWNTNRYTIKKQQRI